MHRAAPALLLAALLAATPARATGGLLCRTASGVADPVALSLVIGHGEALGIAMASLRRGTGSWARVTLGQAWIDDAIVRADIVDADRTRRLARLAAARRGDVYDGTLTIDGRRRWVRCREG